MAKLANLARMAVSSAPGTGSTIGLGAAASGHISFANSGIVNGDVVTYMIVDGSNREIGTATYSSTGPSLTGRTVLNSTNSNAAINATATAEVGITAAASDLVPFENPTFTGTVTAPLTLVGGYSWEGRVGNSFYKAINATYNAGTSQWNRIDTASVAWLEEYNVADTMIYESYQGRTTWVCQPGTNPVTGFTTVGGWKMGVSLSEYSDFTIAGNGIEIDGNYVAPYGRVTAYVAPGPHHHLGLLTNAHLDLSGVDTSASPTWFAGFYDHQSTSVDGFVIKRAPQGGGLSFTNLFTVSNTGQVGITGQPDQFAPGLTLGESTATPSRHVAISLGSTWSVGVDSAGNGTKDWFLYNNDTGGSPVILASPSSNQVAFRVRPQFNGLTPWDSGNFDPSTKADLTSATFSGTVTANTVNATFLNRNGNPVWDLGNFVPASKLNTSGGTLTGKLIAVATSTSAASINLPQGSAPTSPVNGDVWITTGGQFTARINGATRVMYDNGNLTAATTSTTGLMSNTDKTKLDAVGTMANRAVTISASPPSGGNDGDIWYQV